MVDGCYIEDSKRSDRLVIVPHACQCSLSGPVHTEVGSHVAVAEIWDSTLCTCSIVSVGDVQGRQCILTTRRLSEATELPASIKTSSPQNVKLCLQPDCGLFFSLLYKSLSRNQSFHPSGSPRVVS